MPAFIPSLWQEWYESVRITAKGSSKSPGNHAPLQECERVKRELNAAHVDTTTPMVRGMVNVVESRLPFWGLYDATVATT